eukprot:5044752-Heterocapsa_arctica.AAC.1
MSLPTALPWTRWGRLEGSVGARIKAGGGLPVAMLLVQTPLDKVLDEVEDGGWTKTLYQPWRFGIDDSLLMVANIAEIGCMGATSSLTRRRSTRSRPC